MFPTTLWDLSTTPYAALGDCANHRAHLRSQPCSGTGRPVSMPCSGTVLTTEHDYIPNCARELINHSLRCTRDVLRLLSNHSLGIAFLSYIWNGLDNFNFLDLATRLLHRLLASSGTTLVWCIWRCISVSEFLCGFFSLDHSATCLRHLLPRSGTKWAHFTLRWICLLFECLYIFQEK